MGRKPKILIFSDWFAPGFKAGGPIRSVVNMSLALEDHFEVKIITTDTDLGSTEPYDKIESNRWNLYSRSIQVLYLSKSFLKYSKIKQVVLSERADFIYLNSMYSKCFTIFPLLINRAVDFKPSKVVLNPRGMLKSNAVNIKKGKKKVFFGLFKLFGFHKKVHFHFTDEIEKQAGRALFGTKIMCSLIPNIPTVNRANLVPIKKEIGHAKLLFVGRIHPIKNLHFLINSLKGVEAKIELRIVGHIEDSAYWERCKKSIEALSGNITVDYLGEVVYKEIYNISLDAHFLVLPTLGENFGHAIFDAFSVGRPVIISDRTPWRRLTEKNMGWDVDIAEESDFRKAIIQASRLDQEIYDSWSKTTFKFARDYPGENQLVNRYMEMLK